MKHPQSHVSGAEATQGMDADILTLVPLWAVCGALICYFVGVHRLRARGRPWTRGKSAAFATGCALTAAALLPGVHAAGHADFRIHMGQHLILGMLAPIGLVLGAPWTLALRALPARFARRLVSIGRNAVVRTLSHPIPALALNTGGMVALYMTPLYAYARAHGWFHALVHMHFILAGFLFTWVIAGPDRVPGRAGFPARLVTLGVSMAAHAALGKALFAYGLPGENQHPILEIQMGAQLMYYGGDACELLLAVALMMQWLGRGSKPSARSCRLAL